MRRMAAAPSQVKGRREGRRKDCRQDRQEMNCVEHDAGPERRMSQSREGPMFKEFKAFVNQGNAMDLAVGVVIGAAFGKIVDSLVNDIVMPLIGLATGGLDFSQRYIPLHGQDPSIPLDAAKKLGAVL